MRSGQSSTALPPVRSEYRERREGHRAPCLRTKLAGSVPPRTRVAILRGGDFRFVGFSRNELQPGVQLPFFRISREQDLVQPANPRGSIGVPSPFRQVTRLLSQER